MMDKTKGGILMPALPEAPPIPIVKNKIISTISRADEFEKKLDEFIDGLDSYSIQYKPFLGYNGGVVYTALVTYTIQKEEKDVND